jgi:hypothetical protein
VKPLRKGQVLCHKKDLVAVVNAKGKVRGYDGGWPELFDYGDMEVDTVVEHGDKLYKVEVIYKVVELI